LAIYEPVSMSISDSTDAEASADNASERYVDCDSFQVSAHDHHFRFLAHGADRLNALLDLIGGANRSLQLLYFMFQDDGAGKTVLDALVAAAKRGVAVTLILDDFGTDAPDEFFEPLREAGGKVRWFEPRLGVRYLIRNHQKMTIADGHKVITGGFNISDNYFAPPKHNGWCDLGVQIEGPIVERFCAWFEGLEHWLDGASSQLRSMRKLVRDWDAGEGPVSMRLGGPGRSASKWAISVKRDMMSGERLDMAMAYFSPPFSFLRVIRRLAERGRVRIVMAGKSDNATTIAAARSFYRRLLSSGAALSEFQPCKLHMKLIVIDDVTYFGSGNFDQRSIRLNLELMVRVEDAGLAQQMRELIDHLGGAGETIDKAWLAREGGWLNRLRWKLGRVAVLGVDYTVTRSLTIEE
jgi:cardiolipin synthase